MGPLYRTVRVHPPRNPYQEHPRMERSDRDLTCVQCGQPFAFTGGEQDYYVQNHLQDPKRCKPCRGARRAGGPGQNQGYAPPERPTGPSSRTPGNSGYGRRGPQGAQMAAPNDPNGYRSPGFQDYNREPYKIDYAGLPQDDDESDGQAAMLGGYRPLKSTHPAGIGASARGPSTALPRGLNGRRPDRGGTDPDAYRSPGFATAPQADRAGPSRRERRAQRPRFESTCAECGAPALVPFEPSPDRPAFCKPCYQVKKPLLDLGSGKSAHEPNPASTTDEGVIVGSGSTT